MYRDQLRKCVATFTSNYTLYMYYLRVGERKDWDVDGEQECESGGGL